MDLPKHPKAILEFGPRYDVAFFDKVVETFYARMADSHTPEMKAVHDVLAEFQTNPDAYKKCPEIISQSRLEQSKIIALNVLRVVTQTQWKVLPVKQRMGMKAFLEELILKYSRDKSVDMRGPLVAKLNEVLIEIVKREWPQNWPDFISQVVSVSKKSEAVCLNSVRLLRVLCEEASDNVASSITHAEHESLKKNLSKEFSQVFELCKFVLLNSKNEQLIIETLKTLSQFLRLSWIPLHVIFSSTIIEGLCKYYGSTAYRAHCLECVAEIAAIGKAEIEGLPLDSAPIRAKLANMYMEVLKTTVSTHGVSDVMRFDEIMDRSDDSRVFFHNLTHFLTTFFWKHGHILEQLSDSSRKALQMGLQLVVALTRASDKTVFHTCVDFWQNLAKDLKSTLPKRGGGAAMFGHSADGWAAAGKRDRGSRGGDGYELRHPRYALYRASLRPLREVLMRRLPRPKEVLVVKDDLGAESMTELKNTERLYLHKQMAGILWDVSRVDPSDSVTAISGKLKAIESGIGTGIDFDDLQSLCWSIGAVANAMSEESEKSFLVNCIKVLLHLCEKQRTKHAKAVIAACIMYVVRKYPKFLRKHWKFLQTVVRKLIEFLHETHEGVQDMSIETLEEICQQTGHKFMATQKDDVRPFWNELMDAMHAKGEYSDSGPMTAQLSATQRHALYRVWAIAVSKGKREAAPRRLNELLEVPNRNWRRLCAEAKANTQVLDSESTVNQLLDLLKIQRSVCQTAAKVFLTQMGDIFPDCMQLYDFYARAVSRQIADNAAAIGQPKVRAMRALKSEILQLMETFVAKSPQCDESTIIDNMLPTFLSTVLGDFEQCAAAAKESACLNACCALVERLGPKMDRFVHQILKATFRTSIELLKGSIQTMPDHRRAFFRLLRAVADKCFAVLRKMTNEQLKLFIQCLIWGVEHIDSHVAGTSATALTAFLSHVRTHSTLATAFYRQFLYGILDKVLHVMTDALHKQSFAQLAEILRNIALDVQRPEIGELFAAERHSAVTNNVQFVGSQMLRILHAKFPNLTRAVIEKFTEDMFRLALLTKDKRIPAQSDETEKHPFLVHCRDLLVQIKQVHESAPVPRSPMKGPGTPVAGMDGEAKTDDFLDDLL